MKRLLLKLLYVFAYHIGMFRAFRLLQGRRQVIVTYHNVIRDKLFDATLPHLGVSCRESSYVKQLSIIKSTFTVTTEIGVLGSCIVTFDDGYKNNIEIAARHLNEKQIPGLFFVPACYFEGQSLLWVDELLMWTSYVPAGTYTVFGVNFLITQSNETRRHLWTHIYRTLLSNYAECNQIMDELCQQYSLGQLKDLIDRDMYRLRFEGMKPSQLETLKAMGHGLGCHSFKHDILAKLTNDQLENDFKKCEFHSGQYNSRVYSYPFGGEAEVSAEVVNACKKHNYTAAVLNYSPDTEDDFSIGRISLDDLNDKYFIYARLCGFEHFIKKSLRAIL